MKIGFFPMTADLLHAGHILAIEEAKKHCDYLIVGLLCDPTIKNVCSKRPAVQSTYERYIQLRAVKWIDEIIPYDGNVSDAEVLIESLPFDIYFLGSDYKDKEFEGKQLLVELNKEIYYIQRSRLSSTELRKRIFMSEKESNMI